MLRFVDRIRRSGDVANALCWSGRWRVTSVPLSATRACDINHHPAAQQETWAAMPPLFHTRETCQEPDSLGGNPQGRSRQTLAWGWHPHTHYHIWEDESGKSSQQMLAESRSSEHMCREPPTVQPASRQPSAVSNGWHTLPPPCLAKRISHPAHHLAYHSIANGVRKSSSDSKSSVSQLDFRSPDGGAKVPEDSTPRNSSGGGLDGKEPGSWIERLLPSSFRPYAHLARLDKPIGTWLLAWPCFWSIALAAPPGSLPDLHLLALFGGGAVLLRGAGCTVNDLLDQKIDAKVARTRVRPLAAGTVSSRAAVVFLGAQLMLGLGILLQLNAFSQILGASSLLLVFTYPLMKRITYWPQAYLGLSFNWGALLGWAAVHGSLNLPVVLPLYLAGVSWTLVYDTIYAHQDKVDDVQVGVRSTALLFGPNSPLWLTGFSAATLVGLATAGNAVGLGWPFYVAVSASGGQLAWQVAGVDYDDREDCRRKFNSNQWYGAIVFGGIVLGKLYQ